MAEKDETSETWESLLEKEEQCRNELKEVNKHLDMLHEMYQQIDDIFKDIIKAVERFEQKSGDDRTADFDKEAHRQVIAENQQAYKEKVAELEAEKYRLEEELHYLQYRKEQFSKKRD